MPKSLEQLKYYRVHYLEIRSHVKIKGQGVLRSHLKKLSQKIRQLQQYSATIQ